MSWVWAGPRTTPNLRHLPLSPEHEDAAHAAETVPSGARSLYRRKIRQIRFSSLQVSFWRKIIYRRFFIPLPPIPPKAKKSNSESTVENQFLIKKSDLWEMETCGSTSERRQQLLDHGCPPAAKPGCHVLEARPLAGPVLASCQAGCPAGPWVLLVLVRLSSECLLCTMPGNESHGPVTRSQSLTGVLCTWLLTSLFACISRGRQKWDSSPAAT